MKKMIILVLSLLVIGLGSYVIFDKIIDKEAKKGKTNSIENIEISNNDIKLKSLNIEKYYVDENGVNTKISITGKINLEFDENKYDGVTLSGYCLDSNDTKYIITGPSDGRTLYHSGQSDLSLSENLASNVVYKDGSSKSISKIDWKNIELKTCKIEKITGIEKEKSVQSNDDESNTENENINYKSLIGIWYENELAKNYPNSNQLTVKSVDNNKIVLGMYFTRIAEFTNATVELKGNTGEFEAISENGVNESGNPGNAKFRLIINNKTIKLIILQTDIKYLKPAEYTFTYVDNKQSITSVKDVFDNFAKSQNLTTSRNGFDSNELKQMNCVDAVTASGKGYSLEMYAFTNAESAKAEYQKQINYQTSTHSQKQLLSSKNNSIYDLYEAIMAPDLENAPAANGDEVDYMLYLRKDNYLIVLFQSSNNADKTTYINLGNELKKMIDIN